MLLEVFSDEDTNGNNGEEYVSEAAKDYFLRNQIEKSMWSDDYYHRLMAQHMTDEDEIAQFIMNDYFSSMLSCIREQDCMMERNDKGQISAIIYACC